jgi:hypothetical protein
MQAYARSRTDAPELADLVAGGGGGEDASIGDVDMADAPNGQPAGQSGQRGAKRARIFEDHRPMSAITAGIKAGTLHQVRAGVCFVTFSVRFCSLQSLTVCYHELRGPDVLLLFFAHHMMGM